MHLAWRREEDLRPGVGLPPPALAEDGVEGRPHGVVVDHDVEVPVVFEALPSVPKPPVSRIAATKQHGSRVTLS
jgi:hypothetical protein